MSDTFRNALLITLVILLVIILYRRLLRLLGKKDHPVFYATVEKFWFEKTDKTLHITIVLPAIDNIKVDIFREDGTLAKAGQNSTLNAGKHLLIIELSELPPSKYFYKVYTEKQEISKYFHIS